MLCIRELMEQFEIQGAYHIKTWYGDINDYKTLVNGEDFEIDISKIDEDILERKIEYMYVSNNTLNIEVKKSNAEEIACNFYNWLIDMEYCTTEDRTEDIGDMIKDFIIIQKQAPRLFNLLRDIVG